MSSRPMIDGEYDPVVAAANRAAAERRAREARERDQLQKAEVAKKAKAAVDARAAEAKRIADLKAKQAETAATAKRVRESAEKRTQAAAKRVQKRAKTTTTKTSKGGSGARTGDTPAPSKLMDTARGVSGTITAAGPPAKAVVEGLLDGWAATNDKLYGKGNFLTPKEKVAFLKEVQENPLLGYDVMTGVKVEKPPKTIDEALARLQYTVSEIALGGAREVALPFSLKAGQPRRVEDALLQVVGGLLTPSPADFVVSQAFRSLAKLGKKGSRILRKVTQGVELTSDEARQFEKLVGQYGYSTSDLRKAGTKLGKLTQAEWDDFIVKYGKWYKFEQSYSAGAGYSPTLVEKFAELTDDMNYDIDEYIDYLKTYKLNPTFNPATLIAFINGVPPPKADLKAYEKIESDLEKYRESLKQKLEEAQEEAVISGPATRMKRKLKEPQKPRYTPPPEKEKEEEKGKIRPGYTPPPEEVIVDEIIQTVTEELPQTVIEDIDETVIEDVVRTVIEDLDQTVIDETVVEDIVETVTEELGAKTSKKKGAPGSRPNVFRALVGGLKESYRVLFDYPKGKSETFTVTARSFPQALSQATQLRRVKYVPSEVDIAKMGDARK